MTLSPPPLHATPADPDRFARETLRLLGPVPDNWVPDRAGIDHNITIVGDASKRSRKGRPPISGWTWKHESTHTES